MLEPGTVVADKYRIERVIGQGGMGVVLAARHLQLGTRIALKLLDDEARKQTKLVERFVREARASAQLRGEHICRVSDVGEADGRPYLVMELLEGTDLADLVRTEGALPVSRACDYIMQACAGIAEAHAAGIVHRDLKPGNLFLTSRTDGSPLIKVLDFGIAKMPVGDMGLHLTRTTAVIGSPLYMPPEQLRSSKDVDARADIWALGAILFELIAGRSAFDAENLTELAIKIAMDPTPTLDHDLDVVIARCLAKDPDERFADVGELAEAVAPFAPPDARTSAAVVRDILAQSATALPTVRMQGAGSAGGEVTPSDLQATKAGRPSKSLTSTTLDRSAGQQFASPRARWPWFVAVTIAIACIVVGAWRLGRHGESESDPAPGIEAAPVSPTHAASAPEVDASPPDSDAPEPEPIDAAPGSNSTPPKQPSPPNRRNSGGDPYGELWK